MPWMVYSVLPVRKKSSAWAWMYSSAGLSKLSAPKFIRSWASSERWAVPVGLSLFWLPERRPSATARSTPSLAQSATEAASV